MEYRNLGSSGTKVSVIGLGTNNFGRRLNSSDTKKVIDTAIDEGINFWIQVIAMATRYLKNI